MTQLQVHVDGDMLHFERRNVTGALWLSLEGQAFPEVGWDDCPIVILAHWAEAVTDLLDGQRNHKLIFVDGLHRVEVSDAFRGQAQIRLLSGFEVKASASIDLVDFAIQIENAAEIIDFRCRGAGRIDSDVETLRTRLDRLRVTRSQARR